MKNNLKRILAAGASALLLLPVIPGETITSPSVMNVSAAISTGIGDGLSWELTNNNKTLTISGSGTMLDFRSASAVPWRGKASGITKVVLPSGLKNIGAYAFANCSSLKFITIPDTIEKIGVNAFYNSGLQMADFNMTNRTIDETAFYNTPFYRNKFTTEVHPRSNKGAAATMTGKQVVVNIFVNEISGYVKNKTKIKNSDSFEIDPNTEFTFYYSTPYITSSGYYRAKKEDISLNFASSFDNSGSISSSTSFASNRVTSLDDYRYYSKTNFKESELVKTGTRKYLTSTDIKNTLNTVDAALTDLENQAKDYNKTLEFVTNKADTNFFITYDAWDDTLKASDPNYVFPRGTSDAVKKSLINGELHSVLENGMSNVITEDSLIAQLNSKMSKSILKSENASTSEYTEYLKDKYDADGVVYLYHFNTGKKNIYETHIGETLYPSTADEFCAIYDGTQGTMMHEILHLYGAMDFYDGSSGMSGEISDKLLYKYTYSYYGKSGEIMMGSLGSDKIGADTAYLVGLSDTVLKDTFNMLNGKNYAIGDVNMDGVVNTTDSTLISKYNRYKNNLSSTTALTPLQKVLGEIVTP